VKLLVLGASGGCGRWLAKLAVERGHEVTALVRAETSFESMPGLRLLRGDVLDAGALGEALHGQDAVLSALGMKRLHPANPFSRIISPRDFNSASARALLAAMRFAGVARVVSISAAGVAESFPKMSWLLRPMVAWSNVGVAYRDLARMEQVYAQSELDWMAVRPVTLKDGPPGPVKLVNRYGALASISRGSVAVFMLDAVAQPALPALRTPMIAG